LVRECEWKIWSSGIQHRRLARVFYSWGPEEVVQFPDPHGQVNDVSWDDKEVRNLQGWDPDHPFQLPLEFGRNAGEFGQVHGGMAVRDPTARANDVEALGLLWEIYPGWSLAEAAKVANFVEEEGAEGGDIRLRLQSTDQPELARAVGRLIDIDPEHDCLVCRIESQSPRSVTEVVEFAKSASGIWIARELRSTLDGRPSGRLFLQEFTINEPIPASQLQTQFPQGAKVRDAEGSLHLWGDGKPEKTFRNSEALTQYLYARARDYQQGGPKQDPAANAHVGRQALIIVNVIVVALLIFFTLLRRRLSRGA
jgi:hypothetical protein